MIESTWAEQTWSSASAQPDDVLRLPESEHESLIISATQVDGEWIIVSRYGDDTWEICGFARNAPANARRLNFRNIPTAFRAVMKGMMYRYLRRGRHGGGRPKGAIVKNTFANAIPFLQHLEALELGSLGEATAMVCSSYLVTCKEYRKNGKPLSQRGLHTRLTAIEALYELSQYTTSPMPHHPWPETSAKAIAGLTGHGPLIISTPLIPDDIFCILFEQAYQQVDRGQMLLDLRDQLEVEAALRYGQTPSAIVYGKNRSLDAAGWVGGLRELNKALINLRTACYVVLASTSGCRNHEIANVETGAYHRTEDEEGIIYHWMRSRSDKTEAGIHDWMIPEAAVLALHHMERWSEPYQAMVALEIEQRRRINPQDPQIVEARKHRNALFLGATMAASNQVRTLSATSWTSHLKNFSRDCGLSWNLTSHQFRRKFANYAAHSRFGDLRYLKEHFAHWSLDMTLAYAMDESWGAHLELELFTDIQEEMDSIKMSVVENWLGDEPLAGGYGIALKQWKRDPENLLIFKDRAAMLKSISESTAIRSNGHAWCTADDAGCIGNTLDRTRCGGGCNNAVIGRQHSPFYKRLYQNLKELLDCPDIGEGGRQRVERDLNRCRNVMIQLGVDPENLII
ncbi:integrase [Pseudomonas aeruginosa]|jgi:integrase|nr:integrase [Pseudomonas aeruginosa]MCS9139123.1 integrase [Pseudomonas aeruginosa]MCS9211896.1 integrase [Pseudomonas aeruginosa]